MKKIFAFIISFMLVASVLVPVTAIDSHAAFSVRKTVPERTSTAGKTYYYTNNNIFYKCGYGPDQKKRSDGKYVIGNCTWYAYGRAGEMLGKQFNSNFRSDASQWWTINKSGNYYPYGSTPKAGSIACYDNHVAMVESVDSKGNITVSESGWMLSSKKPTADSDLHFHYGSPWEKSPKGYIYIMETVSDKDYANVSYSVKITVTSLNMRKGPGTGYGKVGYVKPGTYKVSQEYGNWVKLADNGYWVCADYVTKTAAANETVTNSGTSANYQVKVSVTNLNMRTGPSTSYKSKGYIKPGTYTVVLTNNGWGKIKETGYWISLQYASKVSGTSSNGTSSSSAAGNTSSASASSTSSTYKVKVNEVGLRMRSGPGTNYSIKGFVIKGTTYEIKDTKNGWGQLKTNGNWIKLSYTIPVGKEFNVKVKYKDLYMRKGPGTSYAKKGFIKPGVHTISQTSGGWGKLKSNGNWIKLSYAEII